MVRLAIDAASIAERLHEFNQRATIELAQERFDQGLRAVVKAEHPHEVGVASKAAGANFVISQTANHCRNSNGLPSNLASLRSTVIVIGSIVGYQLPALFVSDNRKEVIENILADLATSLTTLHISAAVAKRLNVVLLPILQKITIENTKTIGINSLQAVFGAISAIGGAAITLVTTFLEYLTAKCRQFFEDDFLKKAAHKQHANECFTWDAMLYNFATVMSTQVVTMLIAGSTAFGAFAPALATILSVALVCILQSVFEQFLEAKDRAGGYVALVQQWCTSTTSSQRWTGDVYHQFKHLITPDLKSSIGNIVEELVVKPVHGPSGHIHERDDLYAYLEEYFADPVTGIRANPACYHRSKVAERLSKEIASVLGATLV